MDDTLKDDERGLAGVLFDMDGTLVDSEKLWTIGLEELAIRHGGALSGTARTAMVGSSMAESMRILHEDIGQPGLSVADSVEWLERRIEDLFTSDLIWRAGAQQLLHELRAADLPMALVTATRRQLVEVALLTIGADWFDAVVAGDEVGQTKPHPEPYLKAAAALGAEPGRCVAIEDSPNGVRSAAAAGCVVLAVPCEVDLTDLAVELNRRRALASVGRGGDRERFGGPGPAAETGRIGGAGGIGGAGRAGGAGGRAGEGGVGGAGGTVTVVDSLAGIGIPELRHLVSTGSLPIVDTLR